MEIDFNEQVKRAVIDGIRDGVKAKLSTAYSNPLSGLIEQAIEKHATAMRSMLEGAVGACVAGEEFRAMIAQAVNHNLAKAVRWRDRKASQCAQERSDNEGADHLGRRGNCQIRQSGLIVSLTRSGQ